MSSELKRNFARRHITWKIKHLTKENVDKFTVEAAMSSPDFDISLDDNETNWWALKKFLRDESFKMKFFCRKLELCTNMEDEEKKSLGIYLCWMDFTSSNFTVTFTYTKRGNVRSFSKRTQNMPAKRSCWGWPTFISYVDLFNESQNLMVDDVLTLEFEVTIVHNHSLTFIDTSFISARASGGLKVAAIASVKDCTKLRKNARQQEVQRFGSCLLWRTQNWCEQICHFRSMSSVCCEGCCSHGQMQSC